VGLPGVARVSGSSCYRPSGRSVIVEPDSIDEIEQIEGSGDGSEDLALQTWRQVLLINCGGTINMEPGVGRAPGEGVAELVARLGHDFDNTRLKVVSPFTRPPDSSHIGQAEWAVILEAIRELDQAKCAARDQLSPRIHQVERGGIVIAHGTDTMQVTSLVMALEMAAEPPVVPVVFTGSHSPPGTPGSDALNNLAKAIHAATYRASQRPHNLPPGVFVLLGEDIHLAARITKVSTTPDDAGRYFSSFPGPIGQMTSKDYQVKLDQALFDAVVEGAQARRLGLRRTAAWGDVEHIALDRFGSPRVLSDFQQRANQALALGGRPGLVIQGDFSQSPALDEHCAVLRELGEADVPVFLGARRALDAVRATGLGGSLFLLPRALSHSAARLKLSWLLGTDAPVRFLGVLMATSLAGEVFETSGLPSWIKYESFPDLLPGRAVVLAYPGLKASVVRDALAQVCEADERRRQLTIFGFGHGHLPGVNRPMHDVVADHVSEVLPGPPFHVDTGRRGLDLLLSGLVRHLEKVPRDQLFAWTEETYQWERRLLRQVIARRVAALIKEELHAELLDPMAAVLRRVEVGSNGLVSVQMRRQRTSDFLQSLRINIDRAHLDAEADRFCVARGLGSEADLLQRVLVLEPMVLARRLIKDAMMAASALHAAVGEAVDLGIHVEMRSLASRGSSDVSAYEAGQQLLVLGVRSEAGVPWRPEGLTPRRRSG